MYCANRNSRQQIHTSQLFKLRSTRSWFPVSWHTAERKKKKNFLHFLVFGFLSFDFLARAKKQHYNLRFASQNMNCSNLDIKFLSYIIVRNYWSASFGEVCNSVYINSPQLKKFIISTQFNLIFFFGRQIENEINLRRSKKARNVVYMHECADFLLGSNFCRRSLTSPLAFHNLTLFMKSSARRPCKTNATETHTQCFLRG